MLGHVCWKGWPDPRVPSARVAVWPSSRYRLQPRFRSDESIFLAIVLGLIFERLVRVLHLGPPCSSFSMACNRFKRYAMRSSKEPGGFANLPPHRAQKVCLGNALADIAARLADAQEKAGNYWMLEQPATSIMWLISRAATFVATVDVCMFGAPWRKPTSLAASFSGILSLVRCCNGQHTHHFLQVMDCHCQSLLAGIC